jgi:hypothetical protein
MNCLHQLDSTSGEQHNKNGSSSSSSLLTFDCMTLLGLPADFQMSTSSLLQS